MKYEEAVLSTLVLQSDSSYFSSQKKRKVQMKILVI